MPCGTEIKYIDRSLSDQSDILSPTPRRHALLQTDSLEWLRTPTTPRPSSPLNPSSPSFQRQPQSFSSLSHLQSSKREKERERREKDDDRRGAARRWVRY